MTSQVTKILHATIVLFIIANSKSSIPVKSSRLLWSENKGILLSYTQGWYVHYTINGYKRRCKPYLNCEPGHEIQPCSIDYTKDICTSCTNGLVQPALISSSETGNENETKCFAPAVKKSGDIKYSRSKTTAFCDLLRVCECDIIKCYNGDPCLCECKTTECRNGKFLSKTGGCEDCPDVTEKAGKGCGPCRKIQYIYVRETIEVDEVKTSSKTTDTLSVKPSTFLPFTSPMPVDFSHSVKIKESINETMIIVVVVFSAVLVSLLVVVVLILIRKRCNRMCKSKKPNRSDIMETAQENIPLNQIENGEIQNISQIPENENLTDASSDNNSSEMYLTLSPPTQHVHYTKNIPCENSWKCTDLPDTIETKQEHTIVKKVVDDDITEVKNTLHKKEDGETTTAPSVNHFVEMQCSFAPAPLEIHDEDNSKTRGNDQCSSELTNTNIPCENYWNCTDQVSSITDDISSAIEYFPFTFQHCSNVSSDDKDDGIHDTSLKV